MHSEPLMKCNGRSETLPPLLSSDPGIALCDSVCRNREPSRNVKSCHLYLRPRFKSRTFFSAEVTMDVSAFLWFMVVIDLARYRPVFLIPLIYSVRGIPQAANCPRPDKRNRRDLKLQYHAANRTRAGKCALWPRTRAAVL